MLTVFYELWFLLSDLLMQMNTFPPSLPLPPSEQPVQVGLALLFVFVLGHLQRAVLGVVVSEDGDDVVVSEVDRLVLRGVPPPAEAAERCVRGALRHVTVHKNTLFTCPWELG